MKNEVACGAVCCGHMAAALPAAVSVADRNEGRGVNGVDITTGPGYTAACGGARLSITHGVDADAGQRGTREVRRRVPPRGCAAASQEGR